MIDLEQQLIITQVRRQAGPKHGEWSVRLFQTIADAIANEQPSASRTADVPANR
jgi:hypothetical protein